jgi:hypothetical protein
MVEFTANISIKKILQKASDKSMAIPPTLLSVDCTKLAPYIVIFRCSNLENIIFFSHCKLSFQSTKKGQTQCQRLPHEWGLGKGITEAKSYPRRNSAERRLRT